MLSKCSATELHPQKISILTTTDYGEREREREREGEEMIQDKEGLGKIQNLKCLFCVCMKTVFYHDMDKIVKQFFSSFLTFMHS